MKKNYALLVGLLCAQAAAYADVTLYGRVSVAAETDSFPSSTVVQPSTNSIQDYGSYFGIRGTDQVYGQTAAIWQVEQFLDISSGQAYQNTTGGGFNPQHPGTSNLFQNTAMTSRNILASSDSFLGLQGGWGRVRIGNISNTFRTNTGTVDMFNGANANIFGNYDRILTVMPQTIRYDSPTWQNFSFAGAVSFNSDGNLNTGGINGNGFDWNGGMNGYNNSPVYNFGAFYSPGNFSVSWNTQVATNVGSYQVVGGNQPGFIGGNTVGNAYNAYVSRLELGYNDPDGVFLGAGFQISNGLGWRSVPGYGNADNIWIQQSALGAVNSSYVNQAACGNGFCPLNVAQLTTQEIGATIGWHLENFTPKLGYVFGNNMMNGGSIGDIISGNNQIGGTGYQQLIAELDWNITPRTIAFVNFGQLWYGNTAQNTILYANGGNGTPNNSNGAGAYLASNGPRWINNATAAVGLSHTF